MTDTLLIDGDLFLFRATSAVERSEKWDDENWILYSNEKDGYDSFQWLLSKALENFDNPKVRIAFTSGTNFRKLLNPNYKANRKDTRKPMCYSAVKEMVQRDYECLSVPGLEADDIMGIWATSGKVQNPVIVSDDKDMMGVPGRLWRNGELLEITEAQADYQWMLQTLMGDATDGYTGIPGCGPKGAEKVLQQAFERTIETMWPLVVQAYEKASLSPDDALLMARMARILRASDWNSTTKEVILWTPSLTTPS